MSFTPVSEGATLDEAVDDQTRQMLVQPFKVPAKTAGKMTMGDMALLMDSQLNIANVCRRLGNLPPLLMEKANDIARQQSDRSVARCQHVVSTWCKFMRRYRHEGLPRADEIQMFLQGVTL